ncbi:hypothetical protein Tco_1561571 [Tanacetum coccineum]
MIYHRWVEKNYCRLNIFVNWEAVDSRRGGKKELAIRISKKFSLLKEVRPVLETAAYHDKYKKVLDEIWKDKVELDGIIVNENALADTGSDINTMPYWIYEQLGREEMKKVDIGIIMINHTQAEAMEYSHMFFVRGGVTTLIAKFLILDIPIDRDAPIVVGRGFLQSDSDDEEEYEIKRNKFGAPIYGPKRAPYLNCNDPAERSLALQAVTNPFWKISVWKKATMGGNDAKAGSSRSKCSRQFETMEEVLLPQVHHEFCLWEGRNRDAKSGYNTTLANLLPRHICSPSVVNWDIFNGMVCDGEIDDMLRIKLREVDSNKEIFTYVARIRALNIKEPMYPKLCREFYSTYEFDEVCVDDELQTKNIIKFRLGRRAHNLTLLEFAHRLGLYHTNELEDDGFDNSILRVIHKMITYGLCQRTTGYDKFITKIARKARVLNDVVIRGLSAPIYCRDLDTTMLRELIDSEGILIPEDPQPGVPRVGIPRLPRASMQDLYKRMGSMEIHQQDIERMEYR